MPSSSIREASLPGRMPVSAPQLGVMPVMSRAALKKLSFTAFWRRRSASYSVSCGSTAVREMPRAVRPW